MSAPGSRPPMTSSWTCCVEIYEEAGLEIGRDPAAARDAAERSVALMVPRRVLGAIRGNAAILRHADGRSHEEVLDYLVDVGRYPRAVSEKRLEFIEHPLWRTYVFVYAEGEALLRRWLTLVPEAERPARFGRLLHEQLTPGAILAESAASDAAGQVLRERDTIVAGVVVVGVRDASRRGAVSRVRSAGTNPRAVWNATEIRLPGQVIAWTVCTPRARASAKNRSYRRVARPDRRMFGFTPIMWMYATPGWSGLSKPTRKPTGSPFASSASHDVPVKCWNHSRGSRSCIRRPPHQSSTCRTIRAWSASVGRRNVSPRRSSRAPRRDGRRGQGLERHEGSERLPEVLHEGEDAAFGAGEQPQAHLSEDDGGQRQTGGQPGSGAAVGWCRPLRT